MARILEHGPPVDIEIVIPRAHDSGLADAALLYVASFGLFNRAMYVPLKGVSNALTYGSILLPETTDWWMSFAWSRPGVQFWFWVVPCSTVQPVKSPVSKPPFWKPVAAWAVAAKLSAAATTINLTFFDCMCILVV